MKLPIKLVVLISLLVGFTSFSMAAKVATGEQAPLFTLPNIESDKQIALESYKGKVVYLDFWASWCKPCIQSFPELDRIYKKYNKQGFEIVAVNLDNKKSKAEAFLTKHPINYQILHDKSFKVSRLYDVSVMPTGYFIDKTGKVRAIHHGYNKGDEVNIEKAVKLLLAE